MKGDSLTGSIWEHLKPRQHAIEAALGNTLRRLCVDTPTVLADAMGYSLLAPGKRLRPLLVVLACEAAGGSQGQAMPAACAVEMVHTYSLIHDDLPAMDDDDLRRGLPTCHMKYGEALAILAGDALLTMAFEVLGQGYGPKTVAVGCVELARGAGANGMVGGQVLDLEAEERFTAPGEPATLVAGCAAPAQGSARLEDIHRRKTGALFRAALRLGVFAAQAETDDGVSTKTLAAIDRYAAAFGLAFQVTDDLLDVESSAEQTGKRVGKDAARGKLTYPGLLGVEASRRKAQELGQDAVTAAGQLGPSGHPLAELARYVVQRDR